MIGDDGKRVIGWLCYAAALSLPTGAVRAWASVPRVEAGPVQHRGVSPDELGRRTVANLITCLAISAPNTVKAVLDQPFDTRGFHERFSALLNRRCDHAKFAGRAGFPPIVLRGLFYEYFFRNEYSSAKVAELTSAPAVSYPVAENRYKTTLQYQFLMTVGDCVVRKSPMAARDLIVSNVGADEAEAVGVVAKLVPACVPNHESLRLSKSILRAMIAEPLYRLSAQTRE